MSVYRACILERGKPSRYTSPTPFVETAEHEIQKAKSSGNVEAAWIEKTEVQWVKIASEEVL